MSGDDFGLDDEVSDQSGDEQDDYGGMSEGSGEVVDEDLIDSD